MEMTRGFPIAPLNPFGCNPLLTSTDPGQNLPECAQWTQMAARFLETVM